MIGAVVELVVSSIAPGWVCRICIIGIVVRTVVSRVTPAKVSGRPPSDRNAGSGLLTAVPLNASGLTSVVPSPENIPLQEPLDH